MNKLELWCGSKYGSVLYDSEVDGKKPEIFRKKVMGHKQLYFLVVDDKENVFGHYHPSKISGYENTIDSGIFVVTLNNNGRCGIKKFLTKSYQGDNPFTHILYNPLSIQDDFYFCNFYEIHGIGLKTSGVFYVNDYLKGISCTTLTGSTDFFITTRVMVLEMK